MVLGNRVWLWIVSVNSVGLLMVLGNRVGLRIVLSNRLWLWIVYLDACLTQSDFSTEIESW